MTDSLAEVRLERLVKLRALTADVERLRARSVRPEWRATARPGQVPPDGPWRTWYVRGGRDSGKTWTGSNYFAEMILDQEPGTGRSSPLRSATPVTCVSQVDSPACSARSAG